MRKIWTTLFAIAMIGILITVLSFPALSAEAQRISTDDLKSQMGDSELVILDVRGSWDWVKSGEKIAGADRVDPGDVSSWASDYPKGKTIILYCA